MNKKHFLWKINEVDIRVEYRPNLHIEETFNDTTKEWTSDKTTWDYFYFTCNDLADKEHILTEFPKNLALDLYSMDGVLLETWKLNDAKLKSVDDCKIKVEFQSCSYQLVQKTPAPRCGSFEDLNNYA